MTLTELVNEVYTLTGRPDRVAETSSAIKAATLKAHHSDYYWKDLIEFGISFDEELFKQQWEYRTNIPLFRAIKYIRKYDIEHDCPLNIMTIVPPENVLDSYHIQKPDVYYIAGPYVQIRNYCKWKDYLVGCYVHPNVTVEEYNSWVALDHPFAIIFDAANTVFKAIGKDEEAAAMNRLCAEQIAELKISNIIPNGF